VFALLPHKPPCRQASDRTNWKFGTINVNHLVPAIFYRGVSFPVLFTMMPEFGNSSTSIQIFFRCSPSSNFPYAFPLIYAIILMEKHKHANICGDFFLSPKKKKYFVIQIQIISCPGQLVSGTTGIFGTSFVFLLLQKVCHSSNVKYGIYELIVRVLYMVYQGVAFRV